MAGRDSARSQQVARCGHRDRRRRREIAGSRRAAVLLLLLLLVVAVQLVHELLVHGRSVVRVLLLL